MARVAGARGTAGGGTPRKRTVSVGESPATPTPSAGPTKGAGTGTQQGTDQAGHTLTDTARQSLATAAGTVRQMQQPLARAARDGSRQARGALGSFWHAAGRVPRKQLVLYAGLGAAAAVSVIEWPVAVAVAAGSEVARRAARNREPRGSGQR
jgi:hypothetical protein